MRGLAWVLLLLIAPVHAAYIVVETGDPVRLEPGAPATKIAVHWKVWCATSGEPNPNGRITWAVPEVEGFEATPPPTIRIDAVTCDVQGILAEGIADVSMQATSKAPGLTTVAHPVAATYRSDNPASRPETSRASILTHSPLAGRLVVPERVIYQVETQNPTFTIPITSQANAPVILNLENPPGAVRLDGERLVPESDPWNTAGPRLAFTPPPGFWTRVEYELQWSAHGAADPDSRLETATTRVVFENASARLSAGGLAAVLAVMGFVTVGTYVALRSRGSP